MEDVFPVMERVFIDHSASENAQSSPEPFIHSD